MGVFADEIALKSRTHSTAAFTS